jgi:putative toxin-antitoxin system antitoxin component (TIGR02293 family)
MSLTTAPAPASVERLRRHLASDRPSEHFYVALLGLSTFETTALHEKVEAGLSYQALESVRQALDVSTREFADLIWIPTRTLARRKEAKRLQPDESDRLVRLARIVGLTLRLFEGDLAQARRWLLTSNTALADQAPVQMATTEIGAREVEHLIGRLEHGIPL